MDNKIKLDRIYLVAVVVGMVLVSACNAQSYRPTNFDAICAKIKEHNRLIKITDADAVRYTVIEGGAPVPWMYCSTDCMDFMYNTHLPVLADVSPTSQRETPPAAVSHYYDYVKSPGRYEFTIVDSQSCQAVVKKNHAYFDAVKLGSTQLQPVDERSIEGCILVGRTDLNKNIVDIVKGGNEAYAKAEHGAFGGAFGDIRDLPEYFYENGGLRAKLSNIYYQVPPGPSSETCEADMAGLEIGVFKRESMK